MLGLKVDKLMLVGGLAIVLCACATTVGDRNFPEPSEGFMPQKVYDAGFDEIWESAMIALEENRIIIDNSDKSAGRINTDYIQGESTAYVGGLGGVGNSRYKYSISLRETGDGEVNVSVIGNLESSLQGASGTTEWRDLTAENQDLVGQLERWMYEEIERRM